MRFIRPRPAPPVAPVEEPSALDSLAIFGPDGLAEAWVEPNSARLSDRLNRGDAIEVRTARNDSPSGLGTDDVIAIVVQPQPNPSPNRMARRRHVLEMTAAPYQITGTVHMPPGADSLRYLRSVPHRWVAVTGATIRQEDGGGYSAEVVLVNVVMEVDR